MNAIKPISIGIGNGSLAASVGWLLSQAGITCDPSSRTAWQETGNKLVEKIFISRPQHIAAGLAQGQFDCAILGEDMLREYWQQGAGYVILQSLSVSKTTLTKNTRVIAFVRAKSIYKNTRDLDRLTILSEYPEITKYWLKENGIAARIIPSTGSTESMVAAGVYDCGIGITETGASLAANNLCVIDELMEAPVVISTRVERANDKRIQCLADMLTGVHLAQNYALVKMNAEKKDLPAIIALLPALKSPTVHELNDKNSAVVETVVLKNKIALLIVKLKAAGASGIIWHNIDGIVA